MIRPCRALLFSLLAALALAAPAQAGQVSVTGSTLTFDEIVNATETNTLTVSFAGNTFTVVDGSTPLTPVLPCVQGGNANTVTCPNTPVTITSIDLDGADLNDTLDVDHSGIPATVTSSTLTGGPGADIVSGLASATATDTISGGAAADSLDGNAGDDSLNGGDGGDQLLGDAGDDTLVGGADGDDMSGGLGEDTVDYTTATATPVRAAINGLDDSGASCFGAGTCEGDIIQTDVENLTGTGGDDRLIGDGDVNVLLGLGGGDELHGFAGNDFLNGSTGNNDLFGGTDDDTLLATTGDDDLDGGSGNNNLDAGDGVNTLTAGVGNDDLTSGSGNDTITDLEGDNDVIAGDGVNSITTGIGNDTFSSGTGNDTVVLGNGVNSGNAGAGTNSVTGGTGADDITTGNGNDTLILGDGANIANVGNGTNSATGGVNNDSFTGGTGADTFDSFAGDDTLLGADGNDTLNGGLGADVLNGGPGGTGGTDSISYDDAGRTNAVVVDLTVGTPTSGGPEDVSGPNKDTVTFVENVTGGPGGDTLTGTAGDNVLVGLGGDDTFQGDSVFGGGNGADTFNGGAGTHDKVLYTDHDTTGTPNGDLSITIGAGGANDGNSNDENGGAQRDDVQATIEDVTAAGANDTIVGTADDNILQGGGGNDTLQGLGGADVLTGDGGTDTVTYVDRTGAAPGSNVNVTLDGAANDGGTADGNADNADGSVERVTGGSGNDVLTGDGGANTLRGGNGDDTLHGLLGADTLTGDGGTDHTDYSTEGRVAGVTVDTSNSGGDGAGGGAENDDVDTENVTGTGFDDTLAGDTAANVLSGLAGVDQLDGSAGNDTLLGGATAGDDLDGGSDNDLLDGGSEAGGTPDGADTLRGSIGTDTVTYAGRVAPVRVDLDGVADDGDIATLENDDVLTTESIVGGNGGDTLTGTVGGANNANVLDGAGGDDTLAGGTEDEPSPKSDSFIGGNGDDEVTYAGRTAALNLSLNDTADDGSATGPENDLIDGDVEDVTGGNGNDTITGGPGSNDIASGPGDDTVDTNDDLTADTVDCDGGTNDTATIDEFDSHIGASCENLTAGTFPTVSIVEDSVGGQEGNSATTNRTFTVSLSRSVDYAVSVVYSTSNGTAQAPGDFASGQTNTVSFAPSDTSETFTVTVNGDTTVEPDESFTVQIGTPVNAVLGDSTATAAINNDDFPTVSVGNVTQNETNSGDTTYTFTATLSEAAVEASSIDLTTADVSATTADNDYTAKTQTLNFAPGDVSKPFAVTVKGDRKVESDETFAVNLSNAVELTPAVSGAGVGTITNDDAFPALSIGNATVAEGDAGTTNAVFTVTASASYPEATSVDYVAGGGTATSGVDYTATSGTLTIPANDNDLTETITVPVIGDEALEGDETYTVTLSNPVKASIAQPTGQGTITNDDSSRTLSLADASVAEGDSGDVTLTATATLSSASAAPVTVDYATGSSAPASASAPADYEAENGTLTFDAGQTSKPITITVHGDTLVEGNETFALTLSNATGIASIGDGSAVATITDDDTAPVLEIAGVSVAEGNSATKDAELTVTMSRAYPQPVTVKVKSADGSAKAGEDYDALDATLTLPAGTVTAKATAKVRGDTTFEGDESFTVALSDATNAAVSPAKSTGTVTVTNDDKAPANPAITIDDVRVTEGNSGTTPARFTVRITEAPDAPVSVAFATTNATAVAPSDFSGGSGTMTFVPGETVKVIEIAVRGDALQEADEAFGITLSSPVGAALAKATAVGTIVNDDAARSCVVPKVKGVTLKTAKARIKKAGCVYRRALRASSKTVKKGRAIRTSPKTGSRVALGTPVTVTLSKGPKR